MSLLFFLPSSASRMNLYSLCRWELLTKVLRDFPPGTILSGGCYSLRASFVSESRLISSDICLAWLFIKDSFWLAPIWPCSFPGCVMSKFLHKCLKRMRHECHYSVSSSVDAVTITMFLSSIRLEISFSMSFLGSPLLSRRRTDAFVSVACLHRTLLAVDHSF